MRNAFFGRQEELAWLRAQFDACATRGTDGQYGGPRMAFVIAESGLGKSRLVQELYLQLTSDPRWDPPEVDYWPDLFAGSEKDKLFAPDMAGHKPQGPPRFAWLGAGWAGPNDRKSIIPTLRLGLKAHAEIARSNQSLWQEGISRIRAALPREAAGEAKEQIVDYVAAAAQAVFPFGGGLITKLVLGLAEQTVKTAIARAERLGGYDVNAQRQVSSDVDEVLDCFRLLFDSSSAIPVVLWLDDAQWIDDESVVLIQRLWERATRCRWPLLVIVTHWEREWRELASTKRAVSLREYMSTPGVAELHLPSPSDKVLTQCLKSRLPGLTVDQVSLMIDKSAGNFLQLLENIGELVGEPENFIDSRLDGPLTAEAVEYLHELETERKRRVEQRFQSLEAEVKKVLGWSSHLGQRFLKEVIESFAQERLGRDSTGELIERCVDPYVVLDRPSPLTREFRDQIFHRCASQHFHKRLRGDTERLSEVLRSHLSEWLANSVTPSGDLVRAPLGCAPTRCLATLPSEERRDLLGMALAELPLPEEPDWANAEHRAAFWAICWAIDTDRCDALWGRVGAHLDRLRRVQWAAVPEAVCGRHWLESLSDSAVTAGRLRVATAMAESLLASARRIHAEDKTRQRLRELWCCLGRIGDIENARGRYSDALARYEEMHTIARRLLAEEETPERFCDLSASLTRIGDIKRARQQYDDALVCYEESLAIDRRLVTAQETPERLDNLFISIDRIGSIETCRGQHIDALVRYNEMLSIARRLLADKETPERLHYLCRSLNRIGDIENARGQYSDALARYREMLAIARRLLAIEETPERLRDMTVCLSRIGVIEMARGRHDDALSRYRESVANTRRLVAEEETPERLRDLSISLNSIGDIEMARGQHDDALSRYRESLAITRRLLAEEETPDRLRDLCLCLNRIGDIETACGQYDDAFARYEKWVAIARRLRADEETPERLRNLGVSLNRIGSIEIARGQYDDALARYKESLSIFRHLLTEEETPERLRDLMVSLHRIGVIEMARGQHDDALARYEESLSIARHLLTEEETPERLRDLSGNLTSIGDIESARERYDDALARYKESLAITRRLLAEEETPQRLLDLGISLCRIGDIESDREEYDDALIRYDEMLVIARRLLADKETPQRLRDLSISLSRICEIEVARGQYDDALGRYKESLEIGWKISDAGHGHDMMNNIVWSLHRLAEPFSLARGPAATHELLAGFAWSAEFLAAVAADDPNCLDTSAAFWESLQTAARAAGDDGQAAVAAARVTALRQRITELS